MTERTPTPWIVADGQIWSAREDGLPDLILFLPSEWRQWAGKRNPCDGTKEANAAFIVKAVNNHDALVKALEGIAEYCSGEDTTLGALHRLASIRNTALNVLAHVSTQKEPL